MGMVVSGTFSGINWGKNAKFLQVELNTTGGTSYTDLGTTQMMSVPYALFAGSSSSTLNGLPSIGQQGEILSLCAGVPTWGLCVPKLSTAPVVTNNVSTATTGGEVISDAGYSVTARGVCWATSPNPTILDNKIENGLGIGFFSIQLIGLNQNTTYYVRAFATNAAGTGYGNTIVYKTPFVSSLSIGDSYGGGKVACIFGPGEWGYVDGEIHGIISANSFFGPANWGCYGNGNVSSTNSLGTGPANTNLLMTYSCGGAAAICSNYVNAGYQDWFLPSYDELRKVCANAVSLNIIPYTYWTSSSSGGSGYALNVGFGGCQNNISTWARYDNNYVLPIRFF